MQVISGRKDEEKPNRPVRCLSIMIELDDSSQQNCRGDRRKARNNKGADKIVVANNIGNQAGAPREKRVKPSFHHAGRVVAKLRDLQIVKRIPAIPNVEPAQPPWKWFIFQNAKALRAKDKQQDFHRDHPSNDKPVVGG